MIDKIINKTKDKPWIFDLIEGAVYSTIAIGIAAVIGFYALNNRIDSGNDKIEQVNNKSKTNASDIIEFSKRMNDLELDVNESMIKMEMGMDLVKRDIKNIEKKTANYNLSFIVNDGKNKKDIKINNLNNEYMSKLFDDMDTIYNTVSEKGSIKINDRSIIYRIEGKLTNMNEFEKRNLKGLDRNSLIYEVNIEKAEAE